MAAVILEEELNKNYEPTEEEINEYAEWLGMDVEEDKELMWIARSGLKAALPRPWRPCLTQPTNGELFYFNFLTGESVWEHPCDEQHRRLYQKEKAKRKVRFILTLHSTRCDDGHLHIAATNMAGNTLAVFEVASPLKETLKRILRKLKKQLGSRPQLVLPDGRLLKSCDKEVPLSVLLLGEAPLPPGATLDAEGSAPSEVPEETDGGEARTTAGTTASATTDEEEGRVTWPEQEKDTDGRKTNEEQAAVATARSQTLASEDDILEALVEQTNPCWRTCQ